MGRTPAGQTRERIYRFMRERPSPDLLKMLRSLVAPVRFSHADKEAIAALKDSLLAACLDIASSSVTNYPYGMRERFNAAEKRCFFEILESL